MARAGRRAGLSVAMFGLVAFVTAFIATATGAVPTWLTTWIRPAHADTTRYAPAYRLEAGDELVVLYFGKASCGWCNRPELPGALERIKMAMAEHARRAGLGFAVIGVGLDWSVRDGLEHLKRLGEFDEVRAGRNWVNSAALSYFGGEIPGPASTPQVLVIRRTLVRPETHGDLQSSGYRAVQEHLVIRKVGLKEIRQWAAFGAPLPTLEE